VSPKRFNLASVDWVAVALTVTLIACVAFCVVGLIAEPAR
jgi:hypothetical protein